MRIFKRYAHGIAGFTRGAASAVLLCMALSGSRAANPPGATQPAVLWTTRWQPGATYVYRLDATTRFQPFLSPRAVTTPRRGIEVLSVEELLPGGDALVDTHVSWYPRLKGGKLPPAASTRGALNFFQPDGGRLPAPQDGSSEFYDAIRSFTIAPRFAVRPGDSWPVDSPGGPGDRLYGASTLQSVSHRKGRTFANVTCRARVAATTLGYPWADVRAYYTVDVSNGIPVESRLIETEPTFISEAGYAAGRAVFTIVLHLVRTEAPTSTPAHGTGPTAHGGARP